jgi:WD40 repeat protein
VVRIQTEQGEVTFQTDDPNLEVVVTKGGKLVRIVDPQSKQTWQLDPEKFELSMAEQPDGLTITLDGKAPFTLKRKGDKLVTIARGLVPDGKPPIADADADVRRIVWDKQRICTPCISSDGRSLLAGSYSNKSRVWNLTTGELRFELDGAACQYTGDGKYILSGSYDLRLYDAETGKILHEPVKHPQLYGLRISKDGHAACVGAIDGIRLWSLPDLKLLHFWPCDPGRAYAGFAPDGKYLLISFDDKPPLRAWDIAAGKEVDAFQGLAPYVTVGQFTGDGRLAIVNGGKDGLELVDVNSGKVERSLAWYPHPAHLDTDYSPDARRVLESFKDGSVRLSDLETGKELARRSMQNALANVVCFSSDGRYAVAASYDGKIEVWRLPDPPTDKSAEAP